VFAFFFFFSVSDFFSVVGSDTMDTLTIN